MNQLLTTKDVASLLRCSEKHVARLRSRGLRSLRLGKSVRYRPEDVDSFLTDQLPSVSPITEDEPTHD
jgi:excisionase family DNA binding protein